MQEASGPRPPADDAVVAEGVKVSTAEEASSVATSIESADEVQAHDMARRLRISLMLVVGLLAGIILFGMEVAVPVIFVLFLRLVTKERWLTTVATTVISCVTLYLVFTQYWMFRWRAVCCCPTRGRTGHRRRR